MQSKASLFAVGAFLSISAGCGDPGAALCEGVAAPCRGIASGSSESSVAQTFATASAGTTIAFGEGTWKLSNAITCPTAAVNLTIVGRGMDKTILDFNNQLVGSQGITCNVNGLTIEDIQIRDTKGDGIKSEGNIGVTFRRVKVTWVHPDEYTHGGYGFYPVLAENVLIDECVVEGASDAGIYVGQSENVIVRRSRVERNVAGIEIENTVGADVYDNDAVNNTAGILVFSLPIAGTPRPNGRGVRVFDNRVSGNNGINFGAFGNIISKVPSGTGVLVMANDRVEVFGNRIENNNSGQVGVVSFYSAQTPFNDPAYYPFPTNIWLHDNMYGAGGTMPDEASLGIGIVLARSFPHGVPSIIWDGVEDDTRGELRAGNRQGICLSGSDAQASWANLNADELPDGQLVLPHVENDKNPFSCALTSLAPIVIAGDSAAQ